MKSNLDAFLNELNIQAIKYELDQQVLDAHSQNTLGEIRSTPCIAYPITQDQVKHIVLAAKEYSVSYHCISLGKNWGFGDMLSASGESSVLINLCSMDSITRFDEQAGIITIEPGVSLEKLRKFLQEHKSHFMAPVIGTHDSASVMGNLLEKGHSITPIQNRFSSLIALAAVLPNGEIYSSDSGKEMPFYAHGTGPYIDGLFVQSSLGVVTQVTVQLMPAMEKVKGFFIDIHSFAELEKAVDILKVLQNTFFGQDILYRFASRNYFLKHSEVGSLPEDFPFGVLMVVIGGNAGVVSVIMRRLRELFKSYEYACYEKESLKKLYGILFRFRGMRFIKPPLSKLNVYRYFLISSSGSPMSSDYIQAFFQADAAISYEKHENIGLVMLHGVIPFKGKNIASFLKDVAAISSRLGIEDMCSVSSNTFSSCFIAFPILFQKQDAVKKENAFAAYQALFDALCAHGGYVHRFPISFMQLFDQHQPEKASLIRKIKETIDPEFLFARDRYL